MFKEYYPHPKRSKTSDCVVHAIPTATSTDYLECRKELNRKKNELGCLSYKDTKFLYDYFKGYPRLIFKSIKGEPRNKGTDFTVIHPPGTYILKLLENVVTFIVGVILDTWDCSYLSVYNA